MLYIYYNTDIGSRMYVRNVDDGKKGARMKLARISMLVAVTAILFAGCRAKSAVGNWSGTDQDGNSIVMIFSADGTLKARGEDESVSGSYTIDGDIISGTVPGYTFRGTVTGDTMSLTDSEGNTVTLTRQ